MWRAPTSLFNLFWMTFSIINDFVIIKETVANSEAAFQAEELKT